MMVSMLMQNAIVSAGLFGTQQAQAFKNSDQRSPIVNSLDKYIQRGRKPKSGKHGRIQQLLRLG